MYNKLKVFIVYIYCMYLEFDWYIVLEFNIAIATSELIFLFILYSTRFCKEL